MKKKEGEVKSVPLSARATVTEAGRIRAAAKIERRDVSDLLMYAALTYADSVINRKKTEVILEKPASE